MDTLFPNHLHHIDFSYSEKSNGQVDYIGNPNMNFEKTIAYELGYEQNLFEHSAFPLSCLL